MSRELDDLDRRILTILQDDATISLDALSERVALSRNACWRRIQRFDTEGIIRRRVALLDPDAVGLGLSVFIVVRAGRHTAAWAESFRKAVSELPEIVSAHRTAGDIDYLLHARVPDVAAYDRLYQKLIQRVDMVDVSASFVMEQIKDTHALPLRAS